MKLRAYWALPAVFFDAAVALPQGCGGSLGILNITSSAKVNISVWTCAGINPSSMYASGQNFLYAAATKSNASACGNYCADWNGVNAALWYTNKTCACWEFGDINTGPSAATSSQANATFIDFYETGSIHGPNPAQYWGKFTCPQGAYYSRGYWGNVGGCWPLSVVHPKGFLGRLPYSYGFCRDACLAKNGHWVMSNTDNNICDCYSSLSGLHVTLNFSSPYIVVDLYDFVTHSSSSTKTSTKTSTTTKKTTSTKHTSTSTKSSSRPSSTKAATSSKAKTTTLK